MNGDLSNKWLQLEQDVNGSISIEWMLIPPRDKLVGRGFELWSGFAHNIGRTHKACVYLRDKEGSYTKGMFKFDIDSQGRSVLISYTGKNWGDVVFVEYRPEIHRLLSGTWLEGKWEHVTHETGLNYHPTIVGKGDVIYDMCMSILDEMAEVLETGRIWIRDDRGKLLDIQGTIPKVKNHEGLLRESEKFHSIIGSQIPVMPPQLAFHHYHVIPVRVQNGCGGGCTFCDFYANRKIEILSPEDVFNQIDRMAEYLGEEIDHCDQLVLLHGDALTVPTEQLGAELQYARGKFLPVSADAVKSKDIAHAFVKAKTVIGKTVEELRYLRQQGLSYVNMGLETGCKELLSIAKPGQKLEDFSEAVIRLVSAGIRVSVNILAGLGGKKFAYRHVGETLNFLHMLPEEITVFLAYFERKSDSKYVKKQEEELVPLEREELIKQAEAFKSGLAFRVYKYLFIPM